MQRATSLFRCTRTLTRSQKRNYGGNEGWLTKKELCERNLTLMDHLPKAQGSWSEGYQAKNSKANMALGVSVLLFAATIVEMERQGAFDLLGNPAYWSDKQVARQKRYYEKGNKWRPAPEEDDDEE